MKQKKGYTVWLGGIPALENVSKEAAQDEFDYWNAKGYDDVIIEKQ
jgi:hypothetical protein